MNVLLAIDDSSCSVAAVDAVVNQFRPRDTTVRVLHVIEWPDSIPMSLLFCEGASAADTIVRAHDEVRRRARELVAPGVARLSRARLRATEHVIEGEAHEEILAMAKAWPADAIVVGSHRRSVLDRVLLGSVSSSIVRHAPCSVLVVREAVRGLESDVQVAAGSG
jgi:nucleotide-binding universal stress UspA family protein